MGDRPISWPTARGSAVTCCASEIFWALLRGSAEANISFAFVDAGCICALMMADPFIEKRYATLLTSAGRLAGFTWACGHWEDSFNHARFADV